MEIFRKIAEQKIQEAIRNGEFDNLSNAGKPLDLHEDTSIPEDLRIAYKILKNAGCVPPELELRNEIISLRSLINTIDDDKERLKRLRELNFKILKLNELCGRDIDLEIFPEYEKRIYEKYLATD
jgi:hypothetical protein